MEKVNYLKVSFITIRRAVLCQLWFSQSKKTFELSSDEQFMRPFYGCRKGGEGGEV